MKGVLTLAIGLTLLGASAMQGQSAQTRSPIIDSTCMRCRATITGRRRRRCAAIGSRGSGWIRRPRPPQLNRPVRAGSSKCLPQTRT